MKQKRITAVSLFMLAVALLATASVSWAAGGYQYNLQCNGCHGMPPLDDSTRNTVTGGFVGKHTTHLGSPAAAAKCDVCHTGAANPSSYVSGHSDGQIQMFSKYTKGTFFNQTSVPNYTNATCSNINCHFEKLTPTWNSAVLGNGPSDCETCHASSPPNTGTSAQSKTGHGTHTKYPSMAWVTSCDVCHVNHLAEPKPFQHATSAGNRGVYVATGLRYTGPTNDFLPSQTNVFGKCSNTYCHSNGNPSPATQGYAVTPYRMYSSPVFGTTGNGCAICHAASPTTNAHNVHVAVKGYGCVLCHSTTVSSNTAISNLAAHANGSKDVAFSALAGTGSSCSTSYCHASQTGTPTAPSWTAQNSAPCGSCHNAANNTMASKAHGAHLNGASFVYGPTVLQGTPAASSCLACHTNYATTSPTHVNGLVDVTLTSCNPCHVGSMTTAVWGGGRVSCESCHTGATRSLIQGVTAPDMTLSASKGHTQSTYTGAPTCNSCHNPNSAHISGVLGDNVRLTLANDNGVCASCHNVAGKVKPQFANMSTHFTARGVANALCKECHDPHGTTNLSMIRTKLKGTWTNATTYTIVYTDAVNGFVNQTNNRGLCQVCHTKTKFWLAGVPENNHPTSGCLDCHQHNAGGGAFRPSGTCDGCHGYPPVPRAYATAGVDFGVAGKFANGRFEDYTGGGGAHLIAAHINPTAVPADGWKNCAVCHNGGSTGATPNHLMKTPIKTNIANVTLQLDQKLRFNASQQAVYSSAKLVYPGNKTGTCNNVECHFKPSPKWSIQR